MPALQKVVSGVTRTRGLAIPAKTISRVAHTRTRSFTESRYDHVHVSPHLQFMAHILSIIRATGVFHAHHVALQDASLQLLCLFSPVGSTEVGFGRRSSSAKRKAAWLRKPCHGSTRAKKCHSTSSRASEGVGAGLQHTTTSRCLRRREEKGREGWTRKGDCVPCTRPRELPGHSMSTCHG